VGWFDALAATESDLLGGALGRPRPGQLRVAFCLIYGQVLEAAAAHRAGSGSDGLRWM
jgi:hypothetical protein